MVVRADGATACVIGHDMRASCPELSRAFADGVRSRGVDVILIGLASTDGLYYACGSLDLPGAMFTASHNPAAYNGIKMCRAGARPIGQDTGLADVRDLAERLLTPARSTDPDVPSGRPRRARPPRRLRRLPALASSTSAASARSTVVVDAGNGMGGLTVPAVLGTAGLPALPLTVVPLYFELDGTFPNHEANPLDPDNLVDLQAAVREHGADLGLAFDGDADRCFVVDERGEPVSPSAITALVARREIAASRRRGRGCRGRHRLHNLISSRAVPEVIAETGGTRRAHPRRPLVHQGRDGPPRRGLRRRALRPLLLPRLLVRRHRHARGAARARRARRAGRPAERRHGRPAAVRRVRRDQLHRRRRAGRHRDG